MAEEEQIPASQEPETKTPTRKGKFLFPIIIILALIAGGSLFFSKYKVVKAPAAIPSASPTQSPQAAVEAASTTETESPISTSTPEATLTPTPTPTPTPTSSATLQLFKPALQLSPIITFKITKAEAIVDASPKHSGFLCLSSPTFYFTGKITSNTSGTASFRWEDSSGTVSPASNVTFAGAETKLVYTNKAFGAGTYWMKLHVLTPNDISSPATSFSVVCP